MAKPITEKSQGVVLVVDDDPSIRLMTRHVLERNGYIVIQAENGGQALEVYQQQRPDIVLLDALMPELNGFETCARMRQLVGGDHTPILIITALNDDESVGLAFEAGASDYIVKPIHWTVLRRRVHYLLQANRAELALRESEERYRTLVEMSPDAIALLDLNFNMLFCNQQTALLHGCKSPSELLGQNVLELVAAEDHARVLEIVQQALNQSPVKNIECTLLKKQGSRFPAEVSLSRLGCTPGQPEQFVIVTRDITPRKRAEIRLRLLESAVEQANESMLITTAELDSPGPQIVFTNPAFTATTGYTADEVIGRTLEILHGPKTDAAVLERLNHNLAEGKAFAAELINYRKDGSEFDLAWQVAPIRNSNNEITHFITIQHDITQQKRTEAEIQQRNRELTLLNEIIAASAVTLEPEGILQVVCHELGQAFDLTRVTAGLFDEAKTELRRVAEYSTLNEQNSILYETIPVASSTAQLLLAQQTPLVIADVQTDPRMARMRDRLGQRNTGSLLMLPLMDEGTVMGSLSLESDKPRHFTPEEVSLAWSVADQVASVLARAFLIQTREQLSAALEQAGEGVIITDINFTITYVNPAFERITGYNRNELMGQHSSLFRNEQHALDFYQQLWTTISSGQVWHGQFVNQKKDGTLYTAEATVTPVRGENGVIANYVGIQRDVTGELQLEEQLRQSQKMEAIGRLAGGIAHDFNNLVTVINGYSELLLLRHFEQDDPARRDLEQIKKAGQRAAELTKQLLIFSRKQPLQPQALNLNNVVNSTHQLLCRLIGEDLELALSLKPDLAQVTADPGQLEQIIMNLAVNARDAMPQGGKLVISTDEVMLNEAYTRLHPELTPGSYILLAVSDTGTGMNKNTLTHIFEPFFTTKEQGKGTGLGLAIVHSIVMQNKGHIWVESELGQGTTFKIYLPRVESKPGLLSLPAASTELLGGLETILVVEDERSVREIICNILETSGYTVFQAASGDEAIQLCEKQQPDSLHLLLTDVVMPGMNGQNLASHLVQQYPDLKVLYTSGYTSSDSESTTIPQTLSENRPIFLEKPFSPDILTRKVREVLERNGVK